MLKFCTEVNKTLNNQLETVSLQNVLLEVDLWETVRNLGFK